MEIGYLISKILVEVGSMCLVAAGFIAAYKAGLKAGRQNAVSDVEDMLRKNSDSKGICKINTRA